jgi:hypothetical protein
VSNSADRRRQRQRAFDAQKYPAVLRGLLIGVVAVGMGIADGVYWPLIIVGAAAIATSLAGVVFVRHRRRLPHRPKP